MTGKRYEGHKVVTAKEQRKETEEGKLYKERKEISSIFR
jgi:hypothetical protein